MSADRIRKLADTIRMLTAGSRAQNERKRAGRKRMEEEKNRGAEIWNNQSAAAEEMRLQKRILCVFLENKALSKKATATRSFRRR